MCVCVCACVCVGHHRASLKLLMLGWQACFQHDGGWSYRASMKERYRLSQCVLVSSCVLASAHLSTHLLLVLILEELEDSFLSSLLWRQALRRALLVAVRLLGFSSKLDWVQLVSKCVLILVSWGLGIPCCHHCDAACCRAASCRACSAFSAAIFVPSSWWKYASW